MPSYGRVIGRPRNFDERTVLAAATGLFVRLGYEATSIDDLVSATGIHRGSLYKAFGSKHGIFVAALRHLVQVELPALPAAAAPPDGMLDLLLVAALELASAHDDVRNLVGGACALLSQRRPLAGDGGPPRLLGRRLLERARLLEHTGPPDHHLDVPERSPLPWPA